MSLLLLTVIYIVGICAYGRSRALHRERMTEKAIADAERRQTFGGKNFSHRHCGRYDPGES